MSDNVDFVITNEDWDGNFDEVGEESYQYAYSP